jgi:hypothetical protein
MTYYHEAEVTFRGSFPTDMLRYDSCFPVDYKGVEAIGTERVTEPTTVRIGRVSNVKAEPWTVDRWKSFGTNIRHRETRKIG